LIAELFELLDGEVFDGGFGDFGHDSNSSVINFFIVTFWSLDLRGVS
jgi:hypothetical protein